MSKTRTCCNCYRYGSMNDNLQTPCMPRGTMVKVRGAVSQAIDDEFPKAFNGMSQLHDCVCSRDLVRLAAIVRLNQPAGP